MHVRPARAADTESMARIYVQAWRDTYLELVPIDYLYSMRVRHQAQVFTSELHNDRIFNFVAEADGQIIGFCSGGMARNGDCIYSGEIYTLYVLKDWQRQGTGFKLVSRLASRFNRSQVYAMLVWVLKQNPYRRFYEKINGIYLRDSRLPFAGTLLDIVSYGWLHTGLLHG